MAFCHFDASALVKYYIREPGTTWVRALINAPASNGATHTNSIFISEASIAESAAAFAGLFRMQRMSRSARDRAFKAFQMHISNGLLATIPVIRADFEVAADLTQRPPLKAYDAVQLAVFLRYSGRLAVDRSTPIFVSGDKTLLTAARAEGLPTDNSFDHVSPQDQP